jgi:hypothetical protein
MNLLVRSVDYGTGLDLALSALILFPRNPTTSKIVFEPVHLASSLELISRAGRQGAGCRATEKLATRLREADENQNCHKQFFHFHSS